MPDIRDMTEDLWEEIVETVKLPLNLEHLDHDMHLLIGIQSRVLEVLYNEFLYAKADPIVLAAANPAQNVVQKSSSPTPFDQIIRGIYVSTDITAEIKVGYISPQSIGAIIPLLDQRISNSAPFQQFTRTALPRNSIITFSTAGAATTILTVTLDVIPSPNRPVNVLFQEVTI